MTTETARITGTDRYDQEHADLHGFTKEAVQAAQDALSGDDYAILGHLFPGVVTDTEWVLAHWLQRAREALAVLVQTRCDEGKCQTCESVNDPWYGGVPEEDVDEARQTARDLLAEV